MRQERGFTLLEIVVVLAVILMVSAMAYPAWTEATRMYRLRGDANAISGLLNNVRMRGAANFSRVKVSCVSPADSACGGSSGSCTVQIRQFGGTWSDDGSSQRVCLSRGVSFAVPSSTNGAGKQSAITATQTDTIYFNSRGIPIKDDVAGTMPSPAYVVYLTEGSGRYYMAVGIDPTGRTTVYFLKGGAWSANE